MYTMKLHLSPERLKHICNKQEEVGKTQVLGVSLLGSFANGAIESTARP
jgi:hypothetical protein